MAQTFTCKNCHKIKTKNPRLKGQQHYCGDKPCQRARKTAWQKQKMANDSAYQEKQCQAMDNWRKHKPLHQYQKEYRATHPDYVRHNRTRQTIRNQKRASVEQIVNMDALSANIPQNQRFYQMQSFQKNPDGKIVNMDTFIVKLSYLAGSQAFAAAISP
jgi:hypothetical protein